MSAAWETTIGDVSIVLDVHDILLDEEKLEEIHASLDFDKIEKGVLSYDTFYDQVDSMLDDIENQLIESGTIPEQSPKKFSAPE